MNFFKSVFSDEPDPSSSSSPKGEAATEDARAPDRDPAPDSPTGDGSGGGVTGAWSFGGLIKTFATKSESVIQTYRRDLEEFGTGLKKETEAIREAASRVVKDLPVSLEAGASVAQESLESVGQAIDDLGGSVWRGTAEIISQGKEVLLSADDDVATTDQYSVDSSLYNPGGSSRRYSRFEVQVLAIQSDPSTFSEEPEDLEDFQTWKLGFQVEDKERDIESARADNGALESILEKMVPQVVDYQTFWTRYFYKVHKLKQVEDARANLVKRVISGEEEEDLSWEVDDEEEEEEEEQLTDATDSKKEVDESSEPVAVEKPIVKAQVENLVENPLEKAHVEVDSEVKVTQPAVVEQKVESEGKVDHDELSGDVLDTRLDDKMLPEGKAEPGEASKDSDFSVVSSQPSMQEEDDLGWDEIEDLGDHDDKKVNVSSGSSNKVDLHKRLSAADEDEDEDLSWDIEDDEPVKP